MTDRGEKFKLRPITLRMAQEFVRDHHRHNEAPQGHKFSIGLWSNEKLVGVAIVGRPIARSNDDSMTAELTRCCVLEGKKNANSLLYAAAWRAAKGMGYIRMITYTLPSESGVSLKAAGFIPVADTRTSPKGWDSPGRPRIVPSKYPKGKKIRWEITCKG